MSNNQVQVLSLDGFPLFSFGSNGTGDGEFQGPIGIAVNSLGWVYVADRSNHRIQVFDKDGEYQFEFGSSGVSGAALGELSSPYGVFVDSADRVYVSEMGNHRIQVFDKNGNNPYMFGSLGSGDDQLNKPYDLVGLNGKLYVVDRGNARIQVFDYNGNPLFRFGSYGIGAGLFTLPSGIGTDSDNRLFIADGTAGATPPYIHIYDLSGNHIDTFGSFGSGAGQFVYPTGFAVYEGYKIYINDFANNRLQIFEYDKMAPETHITDIGLISDVPNKSNLTYYFTGYAPKIIGKTEALSKVYFKLGNKVYTTNADSSGNFTIQFPVDLGSNLIKYYSIDSAGNKESSRALTLIVGEDNFPDWLKERLYGASDVAIVEEEEVEIVPTNTPEPTPTPIEEQDESIRVLVRLESGEVIRDSEIILNGVVYLTDHEGYITVLRMEDVQAKYGTHNGIKFNANIKDDVLILSSEPQSKLLFGYLWIFVIIVPLILLYIRQKAVRK